MACLQCLWCLAVQGTLTHEQTEKRGQVRAGLLKLGATVRRNVLADKLLSGLTVSENGGDTAQK